MTHINNLAVVSPGRTSSGGSAFSENLVRELQSILGREVATAQLPPTGTASLPRTVERCDAVVFLGARVIETKAALSLFWPLNVAPLDDSINHLPYSSARNRIRHVLLRTRLAQSVRRVDAMAFGSHYAKSLYLARFPAAAVLPYRVIPGGTPSLDFQKSPEPTVTEQRLVLCCSHLYPYKGILQFIEALGNVREALPSNVRVRIAGADRDKTYAAAVRRRIVELRLSELVEVRQADNSELSRLYSEAEVAVFPSTCENAGSFSLFDGFHATVPTICSDRSSMPEMTRGAAVLINPHDAREFGSALVDLLSSSGRQVELRRKSQEWSRSAPTWNDRARMLVEFLELRSAKRHHHRT